MTSFRGSIDINECTAFVDTFGQNFEKLPIILKDYILNQFIIMFLTSIEK